MEPDFRLNTLVDGYAEDLTGGCYTEVRDVEVAVWAKGHAGGNGELSGYVFDIPSVSEAYNRVIARSWEAGSGRELEPR